MGSVRTRDVATTIVLSGLGVLGVVGITAALLPVLVGSLPLAIVVVPFVFVLAAAALSAMLRHDAVRKRAREEEARAAAEEAVRTVRVSTQEATQEAVRAVQDAVEQATEQAAYAALVSRLEKESARRLEVESARRFLEGENAELRELRAELESRLEEEKAERQKAERRYRRERGEGAGDGGQGNVAVLRELELRELGLDKQSQAVIGRRLAHGRLEHAEEEADGRMSAQVRILPEELMWDPAIIVMPHGGDLELEIFNDDDNAHAALFPSNGDNQLFIRLPSHSRGTASLNLDGPGYYWFSSPIGNDEARGLIGAIVVLGDVPWEARLDRPE